MRMRYWLKITGRTLLTGLLGGLVMSLYMMLINSSMTWQDLVGMLPLYQLTMGAMGLFVWNSTAIRSWLPVAIGFGCTRKEALLGLQLQRILAVLGVAVIVAAFSFIKSDYAQILRDHALAGIGVLLLVASVGDLFGLAYERFSAKGILVLVVVVAMAIIFGITLFTLSALRRQDLPKNIDLIVTAAALALWAIDALAQRAMLRRYAVQY